MNPINPFFFYEFKIFQIKTKKKYFQNANNDISQEMSKKCVHSTAKFFFTVLFSTKNDSVVLTFFFNTLHGLFSVNCEYFQYLKFKQKYKQQNLIVKNEF